MVKNSVSAYQPQNQINLKEIKTEANLALSDKKLNQKLAKRRLKLADLQNKMYAYGKYSVLICIQGMDSSGKDSLIREVFKDLNARGIVSHSFKTPSEKELNHDYLWRHYIALPERGKFAVFNRSHYENVLITKVHPEYILSENLPQINKLEDIDQQFWEQRYDEINNFEKHIANNGTLIFKFFLHISKDEQAKRLLRRLEKPNKNWKFSAGDLKERALWEDYQKCYEEAITKTSKAYAPWYIIPADNKKESRLILADILLEKLLKYKDVKEPELDEETQANLKLYKEQLYKELS